MRCPPNLTAPGKAAFGAASERLTEIYGDRAERHAAAAVRYGYAVDLVTRLRAEWVAAGRPTTMTHSNGTAGSHPLVSMLADAERGALRAETAVGLGVAQAARRPVGRPAGAASAPDRRAEPPRLVRAPEPAKLTRTAR